MLRRICDAMAQATLTYEVEVLDVDDQRPVMHVCVGFIQIFFLLILFRFIHLILGKLFGGIFALSNH